jgi:hypothetical protein
VYITAIVCPKSGKYFYPKNIKYERAEDCFVTRSSNDYVEIKIIK